MRYREKANINDFGVETFTYTTAAGVVTSSNTLQFAVHGKHDYIFDEKHKDFFKRVKAGELIVGPLIRLVEEHTVGGGTLSGSHTNGDRFSYSGPSVTSGIITQYGGLPVDPLAIPAISGIDPEAVKLAALAKVDAGQYDFTEDILSLRETVNLLKDPLGGIKDALVFARRKKPLASAAGLWAYARFGVSPFLRSVHDLYESFHAANKEVQPFVRLRSTASQKDAWAESKSVTKSGTVNLPTYFYQRNFHGTVKAIVYYKVSRPRGGLAYKYSSRWKDLPVGFWNIVPLSFMFDRMYSVNNMLEALINIHDPTVLIEGGCVVTTIVYDGQVQLTNFFADPNWSITCSGDTVHKLVKQSKTRTVWNPTSSFPRPSVDFSGLVKDSTKTLDLVAIILQKMKLKI